jgi:hypothetical protein
MSHYFGTAVLLSHAKSFVPDGCCSASRGGSRHSVSLHGLHLVNLVQLLHIGMLGAAALKAFDDMACCMLQVAALPVLWPAVRVRPVS